MCHTHKSHSQPLRNPLPWLHMALYICLAFTFTWPVLGSIEATKIISHSCHRSPPSFSPSSVTFFSVSLAPARNTQWCYMKGSATSSTHPSPEPTFCFLALDTSNFVPLLCQATSHSRENCVNTWDGFSISFSSLLINSCPFNNTQRGVVRLLSG